MTEPQPTAPTNSDLSQGKAYSAPQITVYYDAKRCRHVANCVRGLPEVFNTEQRPWIQAGAAPAEEVARVVKTCPTGALHYVLEGGPPEQPDTPTRIIPTPDGPLIVRGNLLIGDQPETRAALCRCGQSSNKPYCDGTHAKTDWKSE